MARPRKVQTPGETPKAVESIDNEQAAAVSAHAPEKEPAGKSTPSGIDPTTLTSPVFIENVGWLCPEPKA